MAHRCVINAFDSALARYLSAIPRMFQRFVKLSYQGTMATAPSLLPCIINRVPSFRSPATFPSFLFLADSRDLIYVYLKLSNIEISYFFNPQIYHPCKIKYLETANLCVIKSWKDNQIKQCNYFEHNRKMI